MPRPEGDPRSDARRCAFEALYAFECGATEEEALAALRERSPGRFDAAEPIVQGVLAARADLIGEIKSRVSERWSPDRVALTDRVALLIGLWELRRVPDVPPLVAITEAVELAKEFGEPQSGQFVHGLLGAYLADHPERSP